MASMSCLKIVREVSSERCPPGPLVMRSKSSPPVTLQKESGHRRNMRNKDTQDGGDTARDSTDVDRGRQEELNNNSRKPYSSSTIFMCLSESKTSLIPMIFS
jgi:hypothetical protein